MSNWSVLTVTAGRAIIRLKINKEKKKVKSALEPDYGYARIKPLAVLLILLLMDANPRMVIPQHFVRFP